MEKLSDLLNEAIDDRNFPGRATTKSESSVLPSSSTSGTSDSGDNIRKEVNGFMKRANHPKPFEIQFSETEKLFNVPGTPNTPRTSTTPGT